MTKTDIAAKLRQYSTLLAASLLSFVCFSSTSNYLTTDNGLVTCSIDWDTETVTCQSSSSDSNSDCISDLTYYSQLQYNLNTDSTNIRNLLENEIDLLKYLHLSTQELNTRDNLDTVIKVLSYSLSDTSNIVEKSVSLYQHLKSVDCSSCSDGVCPCSNQFAVIESTLSGISDSLVSLSDLTNYLASITRVLGDGSTGSKLLDTYWRQTVSPASTSVPTFFNPSRYSMHQNNTTSKYMNIFNILYISLREIEIALASLNNHFYRYIPDLSRNVTNINNNVSNLLEKSVEHFTFFRDEVSVRPALEDWTPDDGGYYDFLTNYYVRVVNGDSSLSSTSKTNWFSRIETLLASLVFADSVESTNTVDVSSSSAESSDILRETLGGVSDVGSTSSSQLTLFRDTSQNIVSSLRSISASFSRVADPGTVHLVSFSSGSRGSSDSVSFETSDIKNLVEACHCVTTLCWCFGGLLLLYYFLHWTVKTSYGLLMFAWGVFSAIFKH